MIKKLLLKMLFSLYAGLLLSGCSLPVTKLPATPLATASSTPTISMTATIQPTQDQNAATTPPFRTVTKPPLLFPSTPTVSWNTDVIDVNSLGYYPVMQPEWLSNNLANFTVSRPGLSDENIRIDISTRKVMKTDIAQDDTYARSYSPDHAFAVECNEGGRMVRFIDNRLVSSTPLLHATFTGNICSTPIHWAADSSAIAFAGPDQGLYIWRSNGAEPRKIVDGLDQYTSINRSPDSKELVYLKYLPPSQTQTAVIVNLEGRILHEFPVLFGEIGLGWQNQNILVSYSKMEDWFYEIQSGAYLFSWKDMPTGNGIFHQPVQISPDGRWAFIDQGENTHESTSIPRKRIVEKTYTLFDIKAKTGIPLGIQPGNHLAFAGWSADSSKMYLIHLPGEAIFTRDPAMPFGFLSYDLLTGKVELLFSDAVQVKWNLDQSLALVTFAVAGQPGNISLAGGLWKPGSKTVIGQWTIAKQIDYTDSTNIGYDQVSVAWTKDGQSVALCDRSGLVKIINAQGQAKVLTTGLGQNNYMITLLWSPDEQHLLIVYAGRAWVVNVLR
jgi:WD40 repeat protein